jgi:manganese/zinc/iron transport system permease protein
MRDVHLGVEAVMGSADTLGAEDVGPALLIACANGILIALFFWPMQISSFDSAFASSMGLRVGLQQAILLFSTAITCVSAFKAVGVLIVLSFLIAPPLIARMFVQRLRTLLLLSPLIGIGASVAGVALSRHALTVWNLALSTGGIISCLLAAALACIYGIKRMRSLAISTSVQ